MSDTHFDKVAAQKLKGIAIILMLQHHNFRVKSLYDAYTVSFFPFHEDYIVKISLFFKICVSIFAFITGYGLYHSYNNKKETDEKWVIKRYIKTFSGYWFIFIGSCVLCELINNRTSNIYMKDGFLLGIIKILTDFFGFNNLLDLQQLNGTWWYMSCAIVFIIILPFIVKLEKSMGRGYLLLLLTIIIPRVMNIVWVNRNVCMPYIFVYVLGIVSAKYKWVDRIINYKVIRNDLGNKVIKFILEVILIMIGIKLYFRLPTEIFWEIKYGIIPFFVMIWCIEFIINIPLISNILKLLGKHSMNIFLIHTFIRGIYLSDFIYSFYHFILITGVLLFISLAVSILIEKIKEIIKYNFMIEKLLKKIT